MSEQSVETSAPGRPEAPADTLNRTRIRPERKKPRKRRRFRWLRRLQKQMRYRAEYLLFMSLIGTFGLMGIDRAGAAGGWLARTIGMRMTLTRRARRNITRAMPDLTPEQVDAIVRELWTSVGNTMGEYAHLHRFDFLKDGARVTIEGLDIVAREVEKNRGGIFFSGHFANWELMPMAMTARGLPGATIYRAVNNPHVDRWLVAARQRATKVEQISKNEGGAMGIVRALKAKKFVAILVDQKIMEGEPLPFFARPAMTTLAPARLAQKMKCPLIPASLERTGQGRYTLRVHEPIEIPDTGNAHADVVTATSRMNAFLEERIRARPGQWLWLHNRWAGVPKDFSAS